MINLRELRIQKGMSQQNLAEKFNLSQQSIYKYEHGLAEPDINTLKSLAEYFNVTVDYLIGFSVHADSAGKNSSEEITRSEVELIKKLRTLPPEVRSSIITLIENLKDA